MSATGLIFVYKPVCWVCGADVPTCIFHVDGRDDLQSFCEEHEPKSYEELLKAVEEWNEGCK